MVHLRLRRVFATLLVLTSLAGLASCRRGEKGPAETVADPRAYVKQAWLRQPASWCGRTEYNLDDPALLDQILDEALRTRRAAWNGNLPSDRGALDAFVAVSRSLYATTIVATPERRAAIEARMHQRFASPAVTLEGTTAVVDLAMAPAPLVPDRGSSFRLGPSPAVDRGQLRGEHVLRALCAGAKAHPSAPAVEARVQLTDRDRWAYRYRPAVDRVEVRRGGDVFTSPAPVGGVAALCAGRTPTHTAELQRSSALPEH